MTGWNPGPNGETLPGDLASWLTAWNQWVTDQREKGLNVGYDAGTTNKGGGNV